MFASHGEAAADFLCLAKGMSGGYLPMATLVTDDIFRSFLGSYFRYSIPRPQLLEISWALRQAWKAFVC